MGEDEAVPVFVESILFAHPLPGDADLPGALAACTQETEQTRDFLARLASLQEQISEVHLAWEMIPAPVFGDEDRRNACSVAAREGLFRDLVLCRAGHASVNQFLIDSLLKSKVRHRREILLAWVAPFRDAQPAPRLDYPVHASEIQFVAEGTGPYSERGGRDVFERVERQKTAIVEEMKRGRLDLVERYVSDLQAFQLRAGDPIFFCMSLCDLAMKAKGLRLYEFQLLFTKYSIEFRPDDGWSWAQYADALHNNGDLSEALAAYDRSIVHESFVESRVVESRAGRAEVLKSQNRLEEALSAYDEVIADFPDNVIIRRGRAEVLKAQNRLREALSAYDEVIAEFPEDVVARRGRAEVLKAQGRLSNALSAYDELIAEFPQDVFARTGRAEVLKAMNLLGAALWAYEEIISELPQDIVVLTGRAGVLKALGRFKEALLGYQEVIAISPKDKVARNGRAAVLALMGQWREALFDLPISNPITDGDWIGYHIRGMVYLRTGKTEDAVQIFQEGVQRDPHPSSREYFRTALAVAQIQRQAFEQAEETLAVVAEPTLEVPANVLRFHALGAQGRVERALEVWRRLQSAREYPRYYEEIVTELRGRYIKRMGARRADEWLIQSEIKLLLAV